MSASAATTRRRSAMHNAAGRKRTTVRQSLRNLFGKNKRANDPSSEEGPMGPLFPRTPEKKPQKRPLGSSIGPGVDYNQIGLVGLELSGGSGYSEPGEMKKNAGIHDPLGEPRVTNDSDRDGVGHPQHVDGAVRPIALTSSETDKKQEMSNRTLSNLSDRFRENVYYVKESDAVSRLCGVRKKIGEIVNNARVQYFILALIMINAIMIGIATFPVVTDNPSVKSTFALIDRVFLIIFTIEATMQLIYHGLRLFKDAWLTFDFIIVVISWAFDKVQVARAFRIFRALRLLGRIDVMKNLILALARVIPNVTAIAMLLLLVFYIFGVMFTELYKEVSRQYDREEQYFVALPDTLFTLFQIMTLVSEKCSSSLLVSLTTDIILETVQDEWASVYEQAYDAHWWSWILFISFVVISAFIFANLIIAVMCDGIRVMDDSEVAGLTGYEEDQIERHKVRLDGSHRSWNSAKRRPKTNIQKLREMETQLDQIVLMQRELRVAIELIAEASNLEIPIKKKSAGGLSSSMASLMSINEHDDEGSSSSKQALQYDDDVVLTKDVSEKPHNKSDTNKAVDWKMPLSGHQSVSNIDANSLEALKLNNLQMLINDGNDEEIIE